MTGPTHPSQSNPEKHTWKSKTPKSKSSQHRQHCGPHSPRLPKANNTHTHSHPFPSLRPLLTSHGRRRKNPAGEPPPRATCPAGYHIPPPPPFRPPSLLLPAFSLGELGLAELLESISNVSVINSSDPCSWRSFVICSGGASVSGIFLSGFSIGENTGRLFSYLCRLTSLRSLRLSGMSISSLPDEFFSACTGLSGLSSLNLSMNLLGGSLPDFSVFSGMVELDLSSNLFSGVIGSQFGGLDQLNNLNLSNNNLSGSVSTQLGQAMALQSFRISRNRFTGLIPSQLFMYRNLTLLDLSFNDLDGSIPASIVNLTKLETSLLSSNRLSGDLPVGLLNIPTLSRFAANANNFIGLIPEGFSPSLKVLDLSYNSLSGSIPDGLLFLPNLESVDLSHNSLRGLIPGKLSGTLFRLSLSGNSLTGLIPIGIGNLSKLEYFEVSNNSLTGIIPLELSNCGLLQSLNLGGNQLDGPIPNELIIGLKSLVRLRLDKNRLYGPIPDGLSQLSKLSILNMSSNQLTGGIPDTLFGTPKLSQVNLNDNELDGSIPASVQNASELLELQLAYNRFSGEVPRLPDSLSMNLNLSGNNFNGAIPSTLSELQNLEVLDLSDNGFTGEVPPFLTNLRSLTHLDLSNNHLTGNLPKFPKYVVVASSGNELVSSSPDSGSPDTGSRKRISVRLMVVVAVFIALVVGGLSIFGYLYMSRRYYWVEDDNLSSIEQRRPDVILHGHILTTDAFYRSSLDFTKALEAAYVPANLLLKSRLSAYYKTTMPSGKSFCVKKLNWGEKLVQLGNNEKFAEVMEVFGGITNSRIMTPLAYALTSNDAFLIYEYPFKGTLFDFLHSFSPNPLDWQSRYCIALGVAQGLFFLHEFKEPIILLDLSSKGIMLKSITEPQIADVELYRIVDTSKSNGIFSRLAGSVGYTPPEYPYTMRVTMAGNVYSFGVILLELLTGRPPVLEGLELPKWVATKSAQYGGNWDQILDTRISSSSVAVCNQMLSVLKVAQLCVSVSPDARPKMKNAVRMLLNAR